MKLMMRKLVTSPVNAETALAMRRIRTSGFLKRVRYYSSSDFSSRSRNRFGPYWASLFLPSVLDSPAVTLE